MGVVLFPEKNLSVRRKLFEIKVSILFGYHNNDHTKKYRNAVKKRAADFVSYRLSEPNNRNYN